MNTQICPKTWMVESILVTCFCCLPLGVVGIVNASKVSSLFASGNYEASLKASLEAKKWTRIGFIIGLVATVLYLIVYGVTLLTYIS